MSLNVPSGNIMDLGDVHLKLHNTYFTLKKKKNLYTVRCFRVLSDTKFWHV